MRKGGITALFCAFRLEYIRIQPQHKKILAGRPYILVHCFILVYCYLLAYYLLACRPYFDVDPSPPLRLAVALSSNVMPKGRKIP